MSKYQYVTALHGNEPLPSLALAEMGVDQVVANPRALARGVRFTEQDMNASFGREGEKYEERQAREVLARLDKEQAVIDMHTFSRKSPPFAIIVDMKMLSLAKLVGMRRVVYMKHNIKAGHALINHRKGVSVEMGRHDDYKSFERVCEMVKRLEAGDVKRDSDVKVYEVFGRIKEKGKYVNFQSCREGYVPIFYGEEAYRDKGYLGLKAREINVK